MKAFSYARPLDTADAVRLVGERPQAKYLGGGTNLVDLMREGAEQPETLVDVTGLSGRIEARDDGGLLIGAGVAFAQAKAEGLKPGVFHGEPLVNEVGDADAALAAAPHRVDNVYRTPWYNHNAIKPHSATIAWEGNQLTVHEASQLVTSEAATLVDIFGLKAGQVRVTSPYVGGGFGGKYLWDHQILGAAAAKLAGRPVRIALSREGVYRVVGGRSLTEQRVAIGARADGRFDALIHTGSVAMTPHNNMYEPFILPSRSAYAAGSFKLSVEAATMDVLANTFMRAPDESVGTFALEADR